jgi:hypothetical protein
VRRRQPLTTPAGSPTGRPPAVVEPNGLYFLADVIALTRAKRPAVRAAIAAGQLRASVVAGRYIVLGSWLLDWIHAAPPPRAKRQVGYNGNGREAEGERAPVK